MDADLSIVAHSEWEEGTTKTGGSPNAHLWLCSSLEQAQELLKGELKEGVDEFINLASQLPISSAEPMVKLSGDVGSTLSGFLAARANVAEAMKLHFPELGGFWGPSKSGARGDGMLMWVDEEAEFHTAIAHSKSQAASIVRGFDWMNGKRRELLLNEISSWNVRAESREAAQLIEGAAAKLLYSASIFRKYQAAKRRSQN